jgi:hypothetical protein
MENSPNHGFLKAYSNVAGRYENVPPGNRLSASLCGLFLDNSAGGAGVDASAALQAGVLIDFVLVVALMYRAGRADVRAATAGNAITGNNKSHLNILLCNIYRFGCFPPYRKKAQRGSSRYYSKIVSPMQAPKIRILKILKKRGILRKLKNGEARAL